MSLRIVLRAEVTEDDFDDALVALRLRLMNILPATSSRPAQRMLLTEDRSHVLQVVEDEKLGLIYVVPCGPDVERCARDVRGAIATYGPEEIASLLSSEDMSSRALGVKLAALCLPPEDANRALRAARGDPESVVRDAASTALPYVEAPRMAPRPRGPR